MPQSGFNATLITVLELGSAVMRSPYSSSGNVAQCDQQRARGCGDLRQADGMGTLCNTNRSTYAALNYFDSDVCPPYMHNEVGPLANCPCQILSVIICYYLLSCQAF